MIKEKINSFIEKQKKKKPLALASDILFIVLLILLIIPSSRKEIRTFVAKISMSQPRANTDLVSLNAEELSFSFFDEDGSTKTLDDLQGQVIFLNFWATWCPPCRAEMPSIQNLYNDYNGEIKFLLVSNETESTLKNYLETSGYTFSATRPKSEPAGRIFSSSIPATFIIGKDGELLLSKKGAAKWDSENVRNLIENQIKN